MRREKRGSGPRSWEHGVAGAILLAAAIVGSNIPTLQTRYHGRSLADPPPSNSHTRAYHRVVSRRHPSIPVVADPLPASLTYAVTPAGVADALDSLPTNWRKTIASVRLCHQPAGEVMAETDGADIEIHYVVDRASRAPVRAGDSTEEEESFGGVPIQTGDRLWIAWPRRDQLRSYVLKHLLIHEIGHHLAPLDLDESADEEWAEAFAYRYYCPVCE